MRARVRWTVELEGGAREGRSAHRRPSSESRKRMANAKMQPGKAVSFLYACSAHGTYSSAHERSVAVISGSLS